jgi:hypothetical protein
VRYGYARDDPHANPERQGNARQAQMMRTLYLGQLQANPAIRFKQEAIDFMMAWYDHSHHEPLLRGERPIKDQSRCVLFEFVKSFLKKYADRIRQDHTFRGFCLGHIRALSVRKGLMTEGMARECTELVRA